MISRGQELINQYKILHEQRDYGTSAEAWWLSLAFHELAMIKPRIRSLLDFGCGRSDLGNQIGAMWKARTGGELEVTEYDPAIPGIDVLPTKHFDAAICLDVMEHIPEENVADILTDLWTVADNVLFAIHLGKAVTVLPNGENAHCTVKSWDFWADEIEAAFGRCRDIRLTTYHYVCATW